MLVASQPPATVSAGTTFGLTVDAEDAYGNVDPTFSGSITAALAANPGSASLAGTLTANAAAGMATFSGLSLNLPASGYTLGLSASGLASATTSPIDVPPVITVNATPGSDDNAMITFFSTGQFDLILGQLDDALR